MPESGMDARWKERCSHVIAPIGIIILDIIIVILVIMTSVDLFGRMLKESKGLRGPPGDGFRRTSSGHFNLDGKMLRNVREPEELTDVVTLGTIRRLLKEQAKDFEGKLQTHKSSLMELRSSMNADFSSLKHTIKKYYEENQSRFDNLDQFINTLRQLLPPDGQGKG